MDALVRRHGRGVRRHAQSFTNRDGPVGVTLASVIR